MSSLAPPPTTGVPGRFRWLAFSAALATFVLIVAGGMMRVAGTALDCGADWLLCGGKLLPPADLAAGLQLLHRLLTGVVAVLALGTAWQAWGGFRRVRWIIGPALTAVGLLLLQVLLGAADVQLRLLPYLTALHLGVSLIALALLIVVTVVAFQLQTDGRVGQSLLHFDVLSRLAGMAAVSVFGLMVLGALVTAARAGAACPGWPLCDGWRLPDSGLGWLNLGHRLATLVAGVMLATAVWQAWRLRRQRTALLVSGGLALSLFAAQILVGADNVLWGFPTFLNGLHIATAAAVWAATVVFGVLALQYVRLEPLKYPVPQAARGQFEWRAALADYLALTKPIIMLLLLTTTAAAMVVAGHGWPPLDLFLWTMLGGGLASGGASALNQVIDRDLDKHMARTARRPLASGRVDLAAGLTFGLVLSVASFYLLAVFVNPASALLALLGNLYYVLGYTILLKKSTVQNIVIGGGAGAIPPLVGWAAVTGRINMPAVFLFALIFYWTPPHFWALSLLKKNDYARAGVPMLPAVWGEEETRRHILLYTLVVVALSLMLAPAQVAGPVYLFSAAVLGALFLVYAIRLWRAPSNRSAWALYRYSSMYLALIFAALALNMPLRA